MRSFALSIRWPVSGALHAEDGRSDANLGAWLSGELSHLLLEFLGIAAIIARDTEPVFGEDAL